MLTQAYGLTSPVRNHVSSGDSAAPTAISETSGMASFRKKTVFPAEPRIALRLNPTCRTCSPRPEGSSGKVCEGKRDHGATAPSARKRVRRLYADSISLPSEDPYPVLFGKSPPSPSSARTSLPPLGLETKGIRPFSAPSCLSSPHLSNKSPSARRSSRIFRNIRPPSNLMNLHSLHLPNTQFALPDGSFFLPQHG